MRRKPRGTRLFKRRQLLLYVLLDLSLIAILAFGELLFQRTAAWIGHTALWICVLILATGIYFVAVFIVSIPAAGTTLRPIAAGLALLIAHVLLAYAAIYLMLYQVYGSRAFTGETLTAADFLYYSITTFTTTGYGDITSIHALSNAAAASEMLVGFLTSTVLMAVMVGKLLNRMASD